MITNKLSINTNKANDVLFQPPKSTKTISNLYLKFRNNTFEKVFLTRFLGVIINENLSWKNHMDMMKQKMRAALGAVMRIRSYLTAKTSMLNLYDSLLLSHVRYCKTNWCFGNKSKVQQHCKSFWKVEVRKSGLKCPIPNYL